MKKAIDPTYLRTIVDGLSSGALLKDNPSSLPQGLAGVYEDAIPQASQVNERKKFLEFFGVWALMKKEVSAEFVVSLLDGWSEEKVLAYIGRYSKWFNSPASGLYALYHERFRAFVLQKISGSQLLEINNRVIKSCNDALTRQLKDEWERYALEFLSAHLVMPSLENNNRGNELKELAYSTTYWNRQIEVSKGFDWSKRLLNDMMLWASKYDDDQVIECAFKKIQLNNYRLKVLDSNCHSFLSGDYYSFISEFQNILDTAGHFELSRTFIKVYICLAHITISNTINLAEKDKLYQLIIEVLKSKVPYDLVSFDYSRFFPEELMMILISYSATNSNILQELLKYSSSWQSASDMELAYLDYFIELCSIEIGNRGLELYLDKCRTDNILEKAEAHARLGFIYSLNNSQLQVAKQFSLALQAADKIWEDYDGMGGMTNEGLAISQRNCFLFIAKYMTLSRLPFSDIIEVLRKSIEVNEQPSLSDKKRFIDILENTLTKAERTEYDFNFSNSIKRNKVLISRNKFSDIVSRCSTIHELLIIVKRHYTDKNISFEHTFRSVVSWIYASEGISGIHRTILNFENILLEASYNQVEISKCRIYFFLSLPFVLSITEFIKDDFIQILKILSSNSINDNFLIKPVQFYIYSKILNESLNENEFNFINSIIPIGWMVDLKNEYTR
jgi:hypothetical protein